LIQLNGANRLNTAVIRNAKEIFDLLHDDLAAIEREFGRDTVSSVGAITEIGEYLRAGYILAYVLWLQSPLSNLQEFRNLVIG